FVKRFVS
ncbi:glycosyl transferase family, helical bundle domain protein, partial [Vibrio parahaemolyticus VPTS-2010]